ncbi:MAG: hypothetical protein KAK00_01495 [Nanoarchaeota archaeon]|nr:hypothetical protein [Nanoarchaeota archaeon]
MASYKDIPQKASTGVYQLKIRYKGTWDMQDLYESTINWLRERKWKFHEKMYKHKHPSPFGVERQYIWAAEQKVDEFVSVAIDIYIHTYDAHDVEVVDKNREKRIFTKGKIYAYLKITLNWDYEERFSRSPFWGYLKDFYVKYIIKKKLMQGYNARYKDEIVELYQFIMKKLKMETRDFEYSNIAGVHRRGP